jgi:hypothetical protein
MIEVVTLGRLIMHLMGRKEGSARILAKKGSLCRGAGMD